MHFHLTEGPRAFIDTVRVEGSGPLTDSEVRRTLRYGPGAPLDFGVLEASRDSLLSTYGDRGYPLARVVDSLHVDSTRVTVRYLITAGPQVRLGAIRVEGTQKTKPGYVTREMLLDRSEVLRRSRLLLSQQRIYDSGLYRDVQMEIGPVDSASHEADLIVTVRERKLGWVDAGIGYGSIDQLRLTGQWGQRNIFRSSMRFVVTGRLGIRIEDDPWKARAGDRRLDVALTHPWPLGVRLLTTLGAYAENEPVVDEVTDPYPLRAWGGSLTLASSFARDTRSSIAYALRHVTADSLLVSGDPPTIAPDTSYTTHRITLTAERDTRRDLFDPKGGYDVWGRTEVVGGAAPGRGVFSSFSLQSTRYVSLPSRAVLALRLRGGLIEPWGDVAEVVDPVAPPPELNEIPQDERFRTGGASTVRGYLENELGTREFTDSLGVVHTEIRGGQVLLLASAELRFPILWIISGAGFFEGGNVWERPEDMKARKIFSFAGGAGYNDMRYSAGVGLRVGTPVGPLRFDYGWKIRSPRTPEEPDLSSRRGEFHFSLGHPY